MADDTIQEKADIVAEQTISANQKLATAQGANQLKMALAEKLAESHRRGNIDLDTFISQDRSKDASARESELTR